MAVGGIQERLYCHSLRLYCHSLYRGKREEEKELASKHQIHPGRGERTCLRGTGRPNTSLETKISGANGNKE